MLTEQLIIFIKAPRPGFVKTRLAEAIGSAEAAAAYRTLVETLLRRFTGFAGLELHYTPDDALAEVQPWLKTDWIARPQSGGDLGRRLHSAFHVAFTSGARKVVIIGSDCPIVKPDDIRTAWAALETHDVVLGPAKDGGYWLIGLRQPYASLFENMPWSTDTVLQETLNRCRASGLKVFLMRVLSDVDTKEDWQAFLQSLTSRHV